MGLKDFKILFDNPWKTYYPGQNVTGRILLVLDSPKKIRGICVKMKGEANTSWTADKQQLNNEGRYENEQQLLTGHEEYFSIKYNVVGQSSDGEVELKAGEHFYPFMCSLPPNIPSSFESDLGYVRYTIKAILDRPWKFDHETKDAFTVVSSFDLNTESRAMEPIMEEKTKTFCCLCCASAPLSVNISLPVRGYVPGQSMPIKVNVENQSGVEVTTVKLILQKVVTYRVNTPHTDTKTEYMTIAEVSKGPVDGNGNVSYEQSLDIPALPPSNLNNCGIIDLKYELKFEACVDGWYRKNLRKSTLVFIGTVPLANYQSLVAPAKPEYPIKDNSYGWNPEKTAAGDFTPSAPQLAPEYAVPDSSPIGNLYPNLPPPSYEESMNGARSLRDRDESEHVMGTRNHFAPRYPVYNFAQT
ncbi:arrestin domain-containing protein 17-like [Leptopilina boulardi]|uniref:arrestin domain-containing protein 17-like n=1 Tax=Leptopilina boulardi TaxID=63433 RepID=UPI0021F6748E|nr:arrestin domain-containing protein 17-like [Leptopilina boulardi]